MGKGMTTETLEQIAITDDYNKIGFSESNNGRIYTCPGMNMYAGGIDDPLRQAILDSDILLAKALGELAKATNDTYMDAPVAILVRDGKQYDLAALSTTVDLDVEKDFAQLVSILTDKNAILYLAVISTHAYIEIPPEFAEHAIHGYDETQNLNATDYYIVTDPVTFEKTSIPKTLASISLRRRALIRYGRVE